MKHALYVFEISFQSTQFRVELRSVVALRISARIKGRFQSRNEAKNLMESIFSNCVVHELSPSNRRRLRKTVAGKPRAILICRHEPRRSAPMFTAYPRGWMCSWRAGRLATRTPVCRSLRDVRPLHYNVYVRLLSLAYREPTAFFNVEPSRCTRTLHAPIDRCLRLGRRRDLHRPHSLVQPGQTRSSPSKREG